MHIKQQNLVTSLVSLFANHRLLISIGLRVFVEGSYSLVREHGISITEILLSASNGEQREEVDFSDQNSLIKI